MEAKRAGGSEWQQGWALVLACFVGFSFFSLPTASMGVFMQPIGDEFDWGRALIAAGTSIHRSNSGKFWGHKILGTRYLIQEHHPKYLTQTRLP